MDVAIRSLAIEEDGVGGRMLGEFPASSCCGGGGRLEKETEATC